MLHRLLSILALALALGSDALPGPGDAGQVEGHAADCPVMAVWLDGQTTTHEPVVAMASDRPEDRPGPPEERPDEFRDGEDDDDDDTEGRELPLDASGGPRLHPPGLNLGPARPTRPPSPAPMARHGVPRSPPLPR